MGIDPSSLPDEALERMAPADRALIQTMAGHPNAGLTTQEALAKHLLRRERDEQKILVSWLALQEERGILVYDWSRTDRRTTNRKGLCDFRVYRNNRTLLGEMKMDGAKLSPDQIEMQEKFLRAGTEVQIWPSADAGIRAVKNWLWTHWKLWHQGEDV